MVGRGLFPWLRTSFGIKFLKRERLLLDDPVRGRGLDKATTAGQHHALGNRGGENGSVSKIGMWVIRERRDKKTTAGAEHLKSAAEEIEKVSFPRGGDFNFWV